MQFWFGFYETTWAGYGQSVAPAVASSSSSSTGPCGRPRHHDRREATAEGIRVAVETPGGYQAAQLRVAEQYVEKLGLVAKENDTMIVPIHRW